MKRLIIAIWLLACSLALAAAYTDVTVAGTPYLTVDILNELKTSYYATLNLTTIGATTNDYIVAGDAANKNVIDLIGQFVTMRQRVYGAYKTWLQSYPPDTFSSPAEVLYTNAPAWLVDAGLSEKGWRRAYTYDPATNNWRNFSDPMYGTETNWSVGFTNSEIVGPWIIDDLQIGFNAMQYCILTNGTSPKFSWSSLGVTNYYGGSSIHEASWADAKNAAETNYGPYFSSDNTPTMSTHGEKAGATDYAASAVARASAMVINSIYTNGPVYWYGGSILYYAYAVRAYSPSWGSTNNIFDANGYYLYESKYALFSIDSITAGDNDRTSEVLGTTTLPAWCRDPVDGESSGVTGPRRGFAVTDELIFWHPTRPYTR